MKHLFLCLAACFTCLLSFAQTIDDSCCYAYFKITDRLRRGDSLDKKVWQDFVQAKPIQIYLNDQGFNDATYEYYRRCMQIVYMPQKDSILQRHLKAPETYWFTYIIYQYKEHEAEMKKYLKKLETNPKAYFDSCYKYTYTALPKRAWKKADAERFTIIPLHTDAHAEGQWVIYSLLCAYFNDTNKLGVLGGHELHHVLRPQKDIDDPAKKDLGLLLVLFRALNEGTADLVDKRYITQASTALLPFERDQYADFYNEGKAIMPRIDSLAQLAASADSVYSFWTYLNTSNTSGHIPGLYMAYTIEHNGLKDQLLEHIEDPYAFFLIYDEASRKDRDGAYRFSDATVRYVRQLQKAYPLKDAKK